MSHESLITRILMTHDQGLMTALKQIFATDLIIKLLPNGSFPIKLPMMLFVEMKNQHTKA